MSSLTVKDKAAVVVTPLVLKPGQAESLHDHSWKKYIYKYCMPWSHSKRYKIDLSVEQSAAKLWIEGVSEKSSFLNAHNSEHRPAVR